MNTHESARALTLIALKELEQHLSAIKQYMDDEPDSVLPAEMLRTLCDSHFEVVYLAGRMNQLRLDTNRHVWWGAGEPDCPQDIKASNGELHTLRCKVCGLGAKYSTCPGSPDEQAKAT